MSLRKLLDNFYSIYHTHKELGYVTVGNLGSGVLGAIFWLTLAKITSEQAHYGEANFFIALAAILSSVSLFGAGLVLITKISQKEQQVINPLKTVILVSAIGASVFSGIIFDNLFLALLIFSDNIFTLSASELLGKHHFKQYAFLLIGEKIVRLGAALILYDIMSVNGVILGNAVALLAFSFVFFREFRFDLQLYKLRPLFSFISHNYGYALSSSLIIFSDKLVIGPIFGYTVLALYQFAFQFLIFLGLFPASLFQYLLPSFSKNKLSNSMLTATASGSLLLAFLFSTLSPYFIDLFFSDYHDSILPAQIMSFGIIPLGISSLFSSKYLSSNISKPAFISALIYVSLQITLLPILGNVVGLVGLALATVLSLSAQTIVLVLYRRKLNNHLL